MFAYSIADINLVNRKSTKIWVVFRIVTLQGTLKLNLIFKKLKKTWEKIVSQAQDKGGRPNMSPEQYESDEKRVKIIFFVPLQPKYKNKEKFSMWTKKTETFAFLLSKNSLRQEASFCWKQKFSVFFLLPKNWKWIQKSQNYEL